LHVLQSPKSRININSESLWKLKVSYCFLVIKFMFKYGIDDDLSRVCILIHQNTDFGTFSVYLCDSILLDCIIRTPGANS
jgi:hypothetical protein